MWAFPEHIPIREKIERQELLGPKMVLSRMIDGAGKAWPPPISTWVNTPAASSGAVRVSTSNAQEFLGDLEIAGTIEPGKKA